MSATSPLQGTYVALFVASGLLSLVVAYRIRTRYAARGTKTLAYSLCGVGLWAMNSAARTLVGDPGLTLVLLSTELFLVAWTARIWFVFAAQYTNREIHRDRRVQLALYAFVTAALVVPLSNPLHGLVWRSLTPVAEPFLHYEIAKGPAHYAFTLSAYALVAAGLAFLLRMLRSTSHTRAIVSLATGFLLLLGANATPYVVDTAITHSTTIAPLGATGFALMAAVAVHNNLLTVTPVGRARVFAAIEDPVVMLDRDRHIIDHNPAFAEAFAAGADVSHEPFGEACPDLAAELDLPLEGAEHLVFPAEEGEDRSYTITASPLESGPHELGHVLVFRDITDLMTSQWELARKNSQLDEFSDSVAHDLRNPLSVVMAHADLLRTHLEQVDGGDVAYDHHLSINSLDQVENHCDRMSSIIADYLRVSREAKALDDVEPIDFRSLVRDVARAHVPLSSVEVPTDGEIFASAPHVRLLLDTLFRNVAHRATDDLTVVARLTEEGFVVEDTGEPVPREVADQLLEYGYTTQFRGEGLGLSIAKTVAEAHRWTIAIDQDYCEGLRVVVGNVRNTSGALESNDASPAKR